MYKIIVLGDTNTGKTNISHRIISNQFMDTYKATVSVQFLSKRIIIQGNQIKVTIWDTAGQERYRHLTKLYYKKALGVIIVYDITQTQTYQNVQNWVNDINQFLNPEQYRMIIIGNKIDLQNQRKIPFETVKHWYKQNQGIQCFQTSAKQNLGIEECATYLFKEIYSMLKKKQNKIQRQFLEEKESNNYDNDIIPTPQRNSYTSQNKFNNNEKENKPIILSRIFFPIQSKKSIKSQIKQMIVEDYPINQKQNSQVIGKISEKQYININRSSRKVSPDQSTTLQKKKKKCCQS